MPSVSSPSGLSQEAFLIYKGDLNLRLCMTNPEESEAGDEFHEDWSDNVPSVHPGPRWIQARPLSDDRGVLEARGCVSYSGIRQRGGGERGLD